MLPSRRTLIGRTLSLALGASLFVPPLLAQMPTRILVGFPAGGGTDAIARILSVRLMDELSAPVVVENKAGAGGIPATSFSAYVDWVRQQGGGKGAVGIPAPASVPQFLVQEVAKKNGLDLIAAPYRGSAPMVTDMLGIQKVIAQPDVRDKLTAMGLTVGYMSGKELCAREQAYGKVWARIIKDSGFQPQ